MFGAFIRVLALALALFPALAAAQQSNRAFPPGTFQNRAALDAAGGGGGGYTGPGDVVSGAAVWYGLRGYNAAYATGSNPAVDITDQAGSNPLTVNILTNGNLDVATISAWVTAHSVTTIRIAKLYDQTGSGSHRDLTSVGSTVSHPILTLSAIGSLPGMTFDSSLNEQLLSSATYTTSQPFTQMAAAKANAVGSSIRAIIGFENTALLASDSSAALVEVDAGSNLFIFTMVPAQFYSYGGMYNGASSAASFIGSNTNNTTGNAGTNAPSGTKIEMGYDTGGTLGNAFDGVTLEAGIWPGDKSSSFGAMATNQRAYWGY